MVFELSKIGQISLVTLLLCIFTNMSVNTFSRYTNTTVVTYHVPELLTGS